MPAGGQSPSGSRSTRRGLWSSAGWQRVHAALGPSAEELGKLCRQALHVSGSPWPRCHDRTHASGTGGLCSSGRTERKMGSVPAWHPGQRPSPFLPQAGACFIRTHQYPFKVSLPPVVWAPQSALWRQRRIGLCFTYLLTPSLLCGFFSTMSNSCSAAFTFPKSSEMKLAYVNSFHCSFLDPETARRLSRLILTSVLAKPQAPTAELSIAQQGSWRSSTQRRGEDCLTSCCGWQAAALLQHQDF